MYVYIYASLSTSVEYSGGRANIEGTFENRYFHVSKLNVTLTQMGQMGEVYRGGDVAWENGRCCNNVFFLFLM